MASKSAVLLKVGAKVADARSILSVLLLCAAAGMVINLEINGDDEETVMTSITSLFEQTAFGLEPSESTESSLS